MNSHLPHVVLAVPSPGDNPLQRAARHVGFGNRRGGDPLVWVVVSIVVCGVVGGLRVVVVRAAAAAVGDSEPGWGDRWAKHGACWHVSTD